MFEVCPYKEANEDGSDDGASMICTCQKCGGQKEVCCGTSQEGTCRNCCPLHYRSQNLTNALCFLIKEVHQGVAYKRAHGRACHAFALSIPEAAELVADFDAAMDELLRLAKEGGIRP